MISILLSLSFLIESPWWLSDKEYTCMEEMWVPSLGSLEKEMAAHSSILAWEIPWTEEPGRLQSMGSQKKLNTT